MTTPQDDSGVITTLLNRLTTIRLPRALELKAKVDRGDKLGDADLEFMNQVFQDAEAAKTLMARHPELQPLVNKLVALYSEISKKAMENEQQA